MQNEIEFLDKLSFLLTESARWKVAWGGRGAGKTEGYAIALILLARTKRLRILCGREFQNSIDESVKATIEANIIAMGLEDEFKILNRQIVCKRTGSRFFFMGLRYNINKIKSLGRIDICWIEEADKTSKVTLDKLAPTIRGRSSLEADRGGPFGLGPEIWISFNPDLDDDEVYKRFVLEKTKYAPEYVLIDRSNDEIILNKDGSIFVPDPKEYEGNNRFEVVRYAIVVKINYWDNKWFPPDLRLEMNVMKAANENKYLEVWEGHTKVVLEGAIYADELRQVIKEHRKGSVPYNPNKPVYTFWDLGHSDKTAIWFIQRSALEYNIIDYYEDRLKKMPFYIGILQQKQYNYAKHFLPHDGSAETLSNITPEKQLKAVFGKDSVRIVARPSKKAVGINAVRSILPLCNFDEKNTAEGWQCLQRYAYKVDEETGVFSKEPEHDTPWSHGCFTADTKVLTREGPKAISTLPEIGEVLTQWGWKNYENPHLTRRSAHLVEVHFTNGTTVKCTPDHLFLTANGWKSAENLETGLLIQSGLMKQHNSLITKFTDYILVRNILKQMVHCTGMFGLMLLGLYRQIVTFIIKMKSNQIVQLKIWNVCHQENTLVLALNYLKSEERHFIFQKTPEKPLLDGTLPKRVGIGIKSTLKHIMAVNKNEKFSIAYFVMQNLKRPIERLEGVNGVLLSVVMNYLRKSEVILAIGKSGIVKNVGKSFQILKRAVVIIKNFVVPSVGKLIIKEVKQLNEKQDVWCLTVPDVGHFVLANGAIVHNCDGFQTFALSLKTEQDSKKPNKNVETRVLNNLPRSTGWMGAV